MAEYKKRGGEEDIAEVVRKKLEKLKRKDFSSTKTDFKPKDGFEEPFIPVKEPSLAKSEIDTQYKTSSLFEESPVQVSKSPIVEPDRDIPVAPVDESSLFKPTIEARPVPINEPSSVKPVSSKLPKAILKLSIIVFLLAVIIVAVILFLMYRDSTGNFRDLSVNENIQSAVVNNEEKVSIVLSNDVDLNKVSSLLIVFGSIDNSEHPYYPISISREYEINASDINLENFEDVTAAMAFFEYAPSAVQGNESSELSGSAASLGPFVRFWEVVKDFLN